MEIIKSNTNSVNCVIALYINKDNYMLDYKHDKDIQDATIMSVDDLYSKIDKLRVEGCNSVCYMNNIK